MNTSRLSPRSMMTWLALVMAAFTGTAAAADFYKTTGNIAVYLGVLPSELVQGHSPEHPENMQHGWAPSAKLSHHVVVAVFDTKDGSRITHAEVSARVGAIGLAPTSKKLERITIDKSVSYGNYFAMTSPGPYRIDVEVVWPPSATSPVKTSFEYSHPR